LAGNTASEMTQTLFRKGVKLYSLTLSVVSSPRETCMSLLIKWMVSSGQSALK